MYILYCKDYKLAFIMFSRCWSKTMINWIGEVNNIPENERNSHRIAAQNKNMCLNSCNFSELLSTIDETYFVYIMVRNPYDRLLSTTIAHKQHQHMTFKEFVNKYDNHDSIIMSHPKVLLLKNNRNHKIIYFNNFYNELEQIRIKYDIPNEINGRKELNYTNDIERFSNNIYNIKLENFENNNVPYFKYFYDEEMKNKVYNMFEKDFLNFDISKDI
jgi:hypothetical protein